MRKYRLKADKEIEVRIDLSEYKKIKYAKGTMFFGWPESNGIVVYIEHGRSVDFLAPMEWFEEVSDVIQA